MSQSSKRIALGLVVVLVLFGIFSVVNHQQRREPDVTFSDFIGAVERGDVAVAGRPGHLRI